jgi:hypothetical protein
MVNNGFPKQNNLHLTEQMGFVHFSGSEMQNLSAIYAFFSANGSCRVCHTGVGRG